MNVTHIAGGGVAHENIIDAGHAVLANCCGNDWAQSGGLLPPIFIGKYTEAIDPTTNKIKEHPELKMRRRGMELYENVAAAQSGERSELAIHEFIESLIYSATLNDYGPLIAFRNFVFDADKAVLLESLYPLENTKLLKDFAKKYFSSKIRQYEFDNVCILPKIGVILAIEVKSSDRKDAKKQLSRLEELLNAIFAATNVEVAEKISIIKIIATPTIEEILQPDQAFQYCTKRHLQNPTEWWNSIIMPILRSKNKIERLKTPQAEFFTNFTAILAALWAGKIMTVETCVRVDNQNSDENAVKVDDEKAERKYEMRYDCKTFGEDVQVGDRKVDQAHLSSRAGSKDAKSPINDVVFSEKSSVFRTAKGVVLLYLTSEQHLP